MSASVDAFERERSTWSVPTHKVVEMAPKTKRYCVAVFVLNEGDRFLAQLEGMRSFAETVDIVVSDGGSSDGSVAPEKLEARQVRSLLVKTGPGHLGAQMRIAFEYALLEGYKGIVSMDGNNKDDPSAIPFFVNYLDAGYDYLQGSRFIEGGGSVNTPLLRWLGIRWLHAPMISRAAGFAYTDTTNGFRAYSRTFLNDPRVAPFRDEFCGYELHYYLAIRAARLGYRIREVPVVRSYPSSGRTPTKINGVRGYLEVLRALRDVSRHRFDPDPGRTAREI